MLDSNGAWHRPQLPGPVLKVKLRSTGMGEHRMHDHQPMIARTREVKASRKTPPRAHRCQAVHETVQDRGRGVAVPKGGRAHGLCV